MTHELKILPDYFASVVSGEKTFEYRACEDRDFNVGDFLLMREWDIEKGDYTGFHVLVRVTYCLWLMTCGTVTRKEDAKRVIMAVKLEGGRWKA